MKEKKKSSVAILLDYAGSHKGLTFLGLALSAVSMLLSMVPYLCIWLVARDPDRRGTGLDPGTGHHPVRLAGLCVCGGGHFAVLRGAHVHPPGGLPAPRPTSASGGWPT